MLCAAHLGTKENLWRTTFGNKIYKLLHALKSVHYATGTLPIF